MINKSINWNHLKSAQISAEGDLRQSFSHSVHNPMPVGDINSNASGTAARANSNKEPLDLVPVCFWINQWKGNVRMTDFLWHMLEALDEWQKGDNQSLLNWIEDQDLAKALPVLEFGASKYKAWNWAKGMPYSVSLGSCLRHVKAILEGEITDKESSCPHTAHILCNIMFLSYHTNHFPELDDRPPHYKKA